MRRKLHSATHDAETREEIVLAHQVEEAFFVDELNDREKRERTAARLRLIWAHRSLLF